MITYRNRHFNVVKVEKKIFFLSPDRLNFSIKLLILPPGSIIIPIFTYQNVRYLIDL